MFLVHFLVEAAQEVDGIQILPATEFVGYPFALFAGIIQIQHRCDSIHAQTVDVILVEPEHGARHQKASYFAAAIVENVSLPVRMETLPRIGMFVEMCPVEVSQPV